VRDDAREITRRHLERGLAIMQWYLAEALRIRGAVAVPQPVVDAEALLEWLRQRDFRQFRSR
jgi:putative DNA primase/helicase